MSTVFPWRKGYRSTGGERGAWVSFSCRLFLALGLLWCDSLVESATSCYLAATLLPRKARQWMIAFPA